MALWTREELLLALNLYHQTPFGKQHKFHPPIVALADKLDRTPSSVAMKLNNFTSLDPTEQERGVKGLSGASKKDREIWEEFASNFPALAEESEALFGDEVRIPEGSTEKLALVKTRRYQSFFRKAVLGSYGNRCAITGLAEPKLLRASHIIPWSQSTENRLNPGNGICLSGTYDLAFDQFLITFDEDFRLVIGGHLKAQKEDAIDRQFLSLEGARLTLPEKNLPCVQSLQWHREQLS
ncbi:MAG: HNH endonuclease [Akkermansiaceae bacterium]